MKRWRDRATWMAVLLALSAQPVLAVQYTPVDAPFATQQQTTSIATALGAKRVGDAVAIIEAVLRDHADEMGAAQGGVMISGSTWVSAMPANWKAALRDEYRTQFDGDAKQMLDGVRRDTAARPEDFYAVARRYPLSASAPLALAAAGDRALEAGDLAAAGAFYRLAEARGWTSDDRHQKWRDALSSCNGPFAVPLPPKPAPPTAASPISLLPVNPTSLIPSIPSLLPATAPTTAPTAPRVPPPSVPTIAPGPNSPALPTAPQTALSRLIAPRYVGAVPFEATWYGFPAQVGLPKFFPVESVDRLFIASYKQVVALRDNGTPVWTSAATPAPGGFNLLRNNIGRGTNYTPGVLFDAQGSAELLVVRQPDAQDGDWRLRALRASDGKPIWSSDTIDLVKGLEFVSVPAVAGKYVYAVAVDPGHAADTLLLVALDVRSGELLWRCPLGTLTELRGSAASPANRGAWDEFWEQTEPAVGDDLVCIAPNVGRLFAVDRFDGKLRWSRGYSRADVPTGRPAVPVKETREQREAREKETPAQREARLLAAREAEKRAIASGESLAPSDQLLTTRFRGTPAIVDAAVFAAPQDTTLAFACDLATGESLWEDARMNPGTLVGAAGDVAVFQGRNLVGISAAKENHVVWTYDPHSPIAGPAVMKGKLLIVPTLLDWVYLSANDGSPILSASGSAMSLRKMLVTDVVRKTLEGLGALKSFGAPHAE